MSALLPVRGLAASNENLFAPAGNALLTFAVLLPEQPPRPASAEPEARHVGCFLTAVGVPRFDPRPEGKGAGVQNAGMRASVGCRLHWAVSGLGLRGCCVGLAITEITGLKHWLRAV